MVGNQKAATEGAVSSLVWAPSHVTAFTKSLSQALGPSDGRSASECVNSGLCTNLLDNSLLKEWAPTMKEPVTRTNAKELLLSLDTYLKSKIDDALAEGKKFNLDASSFEKVNGHGLEADWLIWQHPAHELAAKLKENFPKVSDDLLRERASLASLRNSKGGIFTVALNVHVLLQLEKYTQFEASIPSRTPKDASSIISRIVAEVLPLDLKALEGASDIAAVQAALQKMIEGSKKYDIIVPLYVAPKEDKQKEEKKGKKDNTGKKADDKQEGGKKDQKRPSPGGSALDYDELGSAIRLYIAGASKRPKTESSAASPAGKAGKAVASSAVAASTNSFPKIWSGAPMGMTNYSLTHVGKPVDFSTTWSTPIPIGHTATSFGAPTAATSSSAQAGEADVSSLPEEVLEAAKKLDIRAGKIVEAEKAAGADKLFRLKVDIGGGVLKQVITGLVGFYTVEQLQNRHVITYCNIKPGKMAGHDSEAMILAATLNKKQPDEQVELLDVPAGVPIGTHVSAGSHQFGVDAASTNPKNISKQWAKVQPLFAVLPSSVGSLQGVPLLVDGQKITCASMTSGEIS